MVQQSTTVAEAQGNEQKANNVDAAMDKLRQSIADNATTKQNQNYTDASPNKRMRTIMLSQLHKVLLIKLQTLH